MIKNKFSNPIFAHAPGQLYFIPYWQTMLSLSNYVCVNTTCPLNLRIVTFNNGSLFGHNNKPPGLLEKTLKQCNVSFDVLGSNLIWSNKNKIPLLLDYLQSIDSEFVLVADSSDVILCNKLESIIDRFKNFECEAVFNSEKNYWPFVSEDLKQFELNLNNEKFLNAGLWIGYRHFAIELLTACQNIIVPDKWDGSEQVRYKILFPNFYPRIKVDYDCRIFQGMNRTDETEISFIKWFL